jgi:hypothetical protein
MTTKESISSRNRNNKLKKIDTKQLQQFITDLQDNKAAFDLFKVEATKKGYIKSPPLPKIHQKYYDRYIKKETTRGASLGLN